LKNSSKSKLKIKQIFKIKPINYNQMKKAPLSNVLFQSKIHSQIHCKSEMKSSKFNTLKNYSHFRKEKYTKNLTNPFQFMKESIKLNGFKNLINKLSINTYKKLGLICGKYSKQDLKKKNQSTKKLIN